MSCVRPANTFPAFPSGAGAAAGIAAINSIGNLGGYFGSKIFGHGQAPWPKIIRAHGAGLFGCVRLRKLRVSAMVRVPQRTPGRPPRQDSPAATERENDHFRFTQVGPPQVLEHRNPLDGGPITWCAPARGLASPPTPNARFHSWTSPTSGTRPNTASDVFADLDLRHHLPEELQIDLPARSKVQAKLFHEL
jgi:hypothetical protein